MFGKTLNKKVSAEAEKIPQPTSEEDFVGLIKYIQEREKNLSKYSDKLRESVVRIANVFGDSDFCQICGKNESHGNHAPTIQGRGQYAGNTYNAGGWHVFKPKLKLSFKIEDEIIFFVDSNGLDCKLLLNQYGLQVRVITCDGEEDVDYYFAQCSRETLKALVQSGRLPKFLALVAKRLAEAEKEYGEVASIAEKIAKSLEA